jgi:CubicO group peptidase (beta-lactamase class C family)
MRKPIHILFALAVAFAVLSPSVSTAHAGPAPTPPRGTADISAAEMEAFFDDYLASQMEANHVAGATVAVVQGDRVLFTKGYGYADVESNVPVDPQKTVFILGSLSKVFTWTAVMQLAGQGKLDLNADVNTYLDFRIPSTYPQPITLNNLMAHNAGFEDIYFGQMKAAGEPPTPLGEWVKTHLPARVRPPGRFSAYSNYGTALAGYIVERVSGMSYDEYVETYLLTPLGMTRTTPRQPIPAALEADMTRSYVFADGKFVPRADFNVTLDPAPAGSFRSTAGDMARFMLAHLNDGHDGQAAILQPATEQLMQQQSFAHDPRVNGMAHGFWEMSMNGRRIIGHAGSHFIFSSVMMLFPEEKLGVFVAVNSQGGMNFLGGQNYIVFEKAFVDHFYPQQLPALTSPADFAGRAARYTGSYAMTMSRAETGPEKLRGLMMAVDVQAGRDGLIVPMLGNARFIEIEPLVFRQADDDTLLVFREDGSGQVATVFLGSNAQTALVRCRWFETRSFNLFLLGAWLLLFLSFEIAAGVRLLLQRKRRQPDTAGPAERAARFTTGMAGLCGLLALAGAFASVFNAFGLYTGNLPLWPLVRICSVIAALLTAGMLAFTALAWMRRSWSPVGRIHYTLVTLGAVGFTWFMFFWNILGRSL